MNQLFKAATKTIYQLSNGGAQREFKAFGDAALYNAVYQLIEYESELLAPGMVRFEVEDSDRMIFINQRAFDYISLPSHQLKRGWMEVHEEELDEYDSEDPEPVLIADNKNFVGSARKRTSKSSKLKLVPRQQKPDKD
jgi:hypothetical protein